MPVAITCGLCGKSFNVCPSQAEDRKYCSRPCRLTSLRRYATEHNHLREHNATKSKATQWRREQASVLRGQGLSLSEIGARLGATRQRIHQLLNEEPAQ